MNSVAISPPHGIVFVLDPKNKEAVIPDYVADEVASFTDSCVSVATQAPDDGETTVFMGREVSGTNALHHVARCEIVVPNGLIALTTSDDARLFEMSVPVGRATVSVWVDALESPTVVVVQVEGGGQASPPRPGAA